MHWLVPALESVFWISVATVFYVYMGFPACLFLLTIGRSRKPPRELTDAELPTVSFVVAAHNEALIIEDKLANCLKIDYPPEKLRFCFVSDSNDGTNEILLRAQSDRISVLILEKRAGKLSALRMIFPTCDGEILVFSDANTYYRPDAIRKLVRHFPNPGVGLVTGDVRILASEQKFGAGERLYYQYERYLQTLESRFWSTVAIDGAMYAVRRGEMRFPGNIRVPDDLAIGMNIGLSGLRMIYDEAAIAEENPTPTDGQEFARKVRTVSASIQSVLFCEGVPGFRQFRLWWVYVSHKLLRWLVPVFLIAALAASAAAAGLTREPFWIAAAALQALFYAAACVGWLTPGGVDSLLIKVPYYFTMVNTAAMLGILRGVTNRQSETWNRTERIRIS